jgi:DNA-binding CsgD family transcriptional regulator
MVSPDDHDDAVAALLRAATPMQRRAAVVVALAGAAPASVVAALVDGAHSALVVGTADGPRLARPALGPAILAAAGADELADAHLRLAEAWADRDPVRAVQHRAAAHPAPDDGLAADLEQVGRSAQARGAAGSAATLLALAADRSVDAASRRDRLLGAARAASTDGDHQLVRDLTAAFDVLDPGPAERAEAAFLRGYSELWAGDPTTAVALLLRASEEGDADGPLGSLLQVAAAVAANVAGDAPTALALARRVVARATTSSSDDPSLLAARGVAAYAAAVVGEPGAAAEARSLVGAVAIDRRTHPRMLVVASTISAALVVVDEHAAADRILAEVHAAAEIGGMAEALPLTLCYRAELATRTGQWHRARALAEQAERAAADGGAVTSLAYAAAALARVAAGQGDGDAARDALDRARRTAEPVTAVEAHRRIDLAAGVLAAVERRPRRAVVPLLSAASASERAGVGDALHGPWAPELVDVAIAAGDRPSLERAVAAICASAERSGRPALAAARRRVEAACRLGSDPDAADDLAAAADDLDRCGLVIDAARARLLAGEHLRRNGRPRDARAVLDPAAERFAAAGARPWAERARAELRAAGGDPADRRRGAPGDLSAQELRIARRAAGGATNREVADELGLSTKTVENTLTRVYAKLHVRRRGELGAALPEPGDGS